MIHPAFEPYLRQAREHPEPSPWSVSADERRRAFRVEAQAVRGELAPMSRVEDRSLELEGRTLGSRLYVPLTEASAALIVYFHGGGFVVGDLDTHDWLCRRLASDTRRALARRRLPPRPGAPVPGRPRRRDRRGALRRGAPQRVWRRGGAADRHGRFRGRQLSLPWRRRQLRDGGFGIAAQVLIYPTLGPELVTDSAHRFGSGYLLDVDEPALRLRPVPRWLRRPHRPARDSAALRRPRRASLRPSWWSPSAIPCATRASPTPVCSSTSTCPSSSSKRRAWSTDS